MVNTIKIKLKLYALLAGCCLLPGLLRAQVFNEIFNQKKTQLKYLTTQIAELQVYLGYLRKGYNIVNTGLNTVRSIKNGEFNLHDLFYTSLGLVNPRIRNSPDARSIVADQQYILIAVTTLKNLLKKDELLPTAQKTYITGCLNRLLADVEKVQQELLTCLTDKSLELTDNERMARLSKLKEYSHTQFVFAQTFTAQVFTLIKSLQQEQTEERGLQLLYDIP